MQDEIVARLANQLQAELIDAEARRAEHAPNRDAMDLVFQGCAMLNRGLTPDRLAKARGFYERALDLDRGNVDALVEATRVDMLDTWTYQIDDPRSLMAAAEAKLSKALAAAPNNPRAHYQMGQVLCATNRAARGIEEFERSQSRGGAGRDGSSPYFHRPGGGNRGSCPGGHAPEPPRYEPALVAPSRRLRRGLSRRIRSSVRLAEKID
jgi:hypothetical protein